MRIEVIQDPDDELREAVNAELRRHNEIANPVYWEKSHQHDGVEQDLNVFAFDQEGMCWAVYSRRPASVG